jgi:hypothetical protein
VQIDLLHGFSLFGKQTNPSYRFLDIFQGLNGANLSLYLFEEPR